MSAQQRTPSETIRSIEQNIEKVMKGQSAAIRLLLAAFASGEIGRAHV